MHCFITLRLSPNEAYARWCDVEEVGKQPYDGFVCLAVSRGSRRSYQQPAVANVQYFVAACARLYADGQGKLVANPSHAGLPGRHGRTCYRSPMKSLTRAPSAINANIGDRSKPPIGGMRRRNGRSNGSVSA